MKAAVVHDRFISKGGAERVAIAIAEALDAPIFTGRYEPGKTFDKCKEFQIIDLGGLAEPSFSQAYPLVRMIDAAKFSGLEELSEFDLVWMSGQWSHFAARNNPTTVLYCHSPPRFLYDMREKLRSRYNPVLKFLLDVWLGYWTRMDQVAIERVESIVANSENVKERIKRFYGRGSKVITPPVEIGKFKHKPPEDFFLSVNRVTPSKRVDMQLDIFQNLPKENLRIVGKAEHGTEYQEKIKRRIKAMKNVKWEGSVSGEKLTELYAKCKATIQTARDEDFGYVPVESFASGKPCIAVKEGGFRESVVDGKTGRLVEEPYRENFVRTIKDFRPSAYDSTTLQDYSRNFSKKRFFEEIREISKSILKERT